MREIKFRGKRKDNNEWIYGFYFEKVRDKNIPANQPKKAFIKTETWDEGFDVNEINIETLGQFTGLYDKNHKPIYEDDIVKMCFCETDDNGYLLKEWSISGEVFYSNYLYGYRVLETINLENGCEYEEHSLSPDIAVIGNIFDNPELLKGE